jgi:hypothetical protein
MNKLKLIPAFLFLMFLNGCALGPLVQHETARTVGANHHELAFGGGVAGFVGKWNYGLTDQLDIGLQIESLSVGARGKYALWNQLEGFSIAAALGAGVSVEGSHYYGDLMMSYKTGALEPYNTLRLVHAKNDPNSTIEPGSLRFKLTESEYDYAHYILGVRYWLTPQWLFSVEASTIFALPASVSIDRNFIGGAALGYRF